VFTAETDAEDAASAEYDTYRTSVTDLWRNYVTDHDDDHGDKFGLSTAFKQWAGQHLGRMMDIGLSLNEIESTIYKLQDMFYQEVGNDAFDEITGPTTGYGLQNYYDDAKGMYQNTMTGEARGVAEGGGFWKTLTGEGATPEEDLTNPYV